MNVIATNTTTKVAGPKRIEVERLSDHGTHSLIEGILNTGFLPKRAAAYAKPAVEVSLCDEQTRLLPALKAAAECRAREIARRARHRAEDPSREWPSPSFASVCAEILFDSQVRRGPVDLPPQLVPALIRVS